MVCRPGVGIQVAEQPGNLFQSLMAGNTGGIPTVSHTSVRPGRQDKAKFGEKAEFMCDK